LWWYECLAHRHADFNFFIHDADREFAIKEFSLDAARCTTITYGIETGNAPTNEERQRCKSILQKLHTISTNQTIYLFNGALDYSPNLEAVKNIVDHINPYLLASGHSYKIIICGRGLPVTMKSLEQYADKNIIYAGFVDDISVYFKGADIFINAVVEGGGIKTKMVEALGYNTKVISTQNGSIGVAEHETAGKLIVVKDKDWEGFSKQMILAAGSPATQIPDSFYKKFYWKNIALKAAGFIKQ
jgi:glycosyltransferase involved in cell wall biosynthesis